MSEAKCGRGEVISPQRANPPPDPPSLALRRAPLPLRGRDKKAGSDFKQQT